MPPRWLTLLIVAFWVGTTGWLVYRECLDRAHTGEPPRFAIDLTDEVSANTIAWNVVEQGELVGMGQSSVRRRRNRTFEFRSEFRFNEVGIYKLLKFRKMTSMYRVNEDGQFLALAAEVHFDGNGLFDIVTISGELRHGVVVPSIKGLVGDKKVDLPFKGEIKVAERSSILNPMHLVSKINGLYAGQTWRIPLLEPFAALVPGQGIGELKAEVFRDHLLWQKHNVPCYRIDYREPGKKVTARTWVQQSDGLVLQQEAAHQGREIVLVRDKVPERK